MKSIVFKSLLLLSLPLIGISKNSKAIQMYAVGKAIVDPTLKKNESTLELSFYTYNNLMLNQSFQLSYNGIEKKIATDKKGVYTLLLKPSKYKLQLFYNDTFFEITTDSIKTKDGMKTPVALFFTSSEQPVMAEKPVIYMYAPDTTDVDLKLLTKTPLSFTYPQYKDSWKVKASPSGDIISGKSVYPYLFWEGEIEIAPTDINPSKGFVVTKENLVSFFEEKLTLMGLNQKEQTDFITYWCPRMSEYNASFVHFLFNEEVENYAQMNITPKPDNLFRVLMTWTPSTKIVLVTDVQEQEIPSLKRNGLSIIEWGGAELKLTNP
jgi:hypothetical protein